MSDWPADAEQIELARNRPQPKADGAFRLMTMAWVWRNGGAVQFACEHAFQSSTARDEFKALALKSGLRAEECE